MSGMQIRAFRPLGNNQTVNIVVTAVSQSLAIPAVPFGTRALRCVNSGTQTVFIEFVQTSNTAVISTSMPILANTTDTFTLPNDIVSLSVVASGTGSTLYITPGEGI